jgi:excisionase family DNA binding protein
MCDPVLLLTVPQCAERLGLGRSTVYQFIRTGALPSLRVGRLRRVAAADLDAFVQRLKGS